MVHSRRYQICKVDKNGIELAQIAQKARVDPSINLVRVSHAASSGVIFHRHKVTLANTRWPVVIAGLADYGMT